MEAHWLHSGHAIGKSRTLVVSTTQPAMRYFNGRRYYTETSIDHFVHPNDRKRDFSLHVAYVALLRQTIGTFPHAAVSYDYKTMRYSQMSWRESCTE